MIEAIEILSRETGANWFSIVLILKDRGLLNPPQIKHIENYFFDQEEQSNASHQTGS